MATVTGKTSIKIDDLINDTIIDGEMVGGHLLLRSRGGAEIDAGLIDGSGGGGSTGSGGAAVALDVREFGTVASDGSVTHEAVNAGIAALNALKGGELWVPCPVNVYDTIIHKTNVIVQATGSEDHHDVGAMFQQTPAVFTWRGNAGGTLMRFASPINPTGQKSVRGGIRNLALHSGFGSAKAGRLVEILSWDFGIAENIFTFEATDTAWFLGCHPGGSLGEVHDTQNWSFMNLSGRQIAQGPGGGNFMTLTGNEGQALVTRYANTSLNYFYNIGCSYDGCATEGCLALYDSDNNRFYGPRFRASNPSTSSAIVCHAGATSNNARANAFYDYSGSGAIKVNGTEEAAVPAHDNAFWFMDSGNNVAAPISGTGVTGVSGSFADGTQFGQSMLKAAVGDSRILAKEAQAAIVNESIRISNSSSDNMRLIHSTTDDEWGVNVNGTNGNLRDVKIAGSGVREFTTPVQLRSYSETSLPPAAPGGQLVHVSNATGGAVPAISDGTAWNLLGKQDGTGVLSSFTTLSSFGSPVGNGIADETTLIQLAFASGRTVYIQKPSNYFRITKTLSVTNGTVIIMEEGTEIRLDSTSLSAILNLDAHTGFKIKGGILNGNKAITATGECISMDNSVDCHVEVTLLNASSSTFGAIVLSGTSTGNTIKVDSTGCELTVICLTGANVTDNSIIGCHLQGQLGFGIRLGEGANGNLIANNRTTASTLELVGITSDCEYNRVAFNKASGSGDNGISISGSHNTVVGNVCRLNQRAGIWVWGSFNTISGNTCVGNNLENTLWAGIGVSSNFGGCGQFNTIEGNVCDDDRATPTQWNGIRLGGTGYTNWATGQTGIVAGSTYRVNGLNIYIATTSGTTGATAPTHTTGTVSDGSIFWSYKRSYLVAAGSWYNSIADNVVPRFASAAYFDADNWLHNSLKSHSVSTALIQAGSVRVAVDAGLAFIVKVGTADELEIDATEIRPTTDGGLSLGLVNRQFTNLYLNTALVVNGNAVVSSRRTGYGAAWSGAVNRSTVYGTTTVTLPQLAARVAALEADLKSHGLIGT